MSEEILRALMELFALIVKQDGGTLLNERAYVSDFLKKQLTKDSVNEYLALFDEQAGPVLTRQAVLHTFSSICKRLCKNTRHLQED